MKDLGSCKKKWLLIGWGRAIKEFFDFYHEIKLRKHAGLKRDFKNEMKEV